MKNYYEILRINKSASKEEIRKAFKQLSLKYHPDKNNGNAYCGEIFKDINEAHQVLSNDLKKREYDISFINYNIKRTVLHNNLTDVINQDLNAAKRTFIKKQVLRAAGIPAAIAFVLFVFIIFFKTNDNNLSLYAASGTGSGNDKKTFEKALKEFRLADAKSDKKTALTTAKIEMKPIYTVVTQQKILPQIETKSTTTEDLFKIQEKELTEEDMDEVLKEINWQKNKHNSETKCVKIIKTKKSNIKNGFAIAQFFKKKGYSIGGREIVGENTSGIKVGVSSNYVLVTLGNL